MTVNELRGAVLAQRGDRPVSRSGHDLVAAGRESDGVDPILDDGVGDDR
jgi:hypothetical protein